MDLNAQEFFLVVSLVAALHLWSRKQNDDTDELSKTSEAQHYLISSMCFLVAVMAGIVALCTGRVSYPVQFWVFMGLDSFCCLVSWAVYLENRPKTKEAGQKIGKQMKEHADAYYAAVARGRIGRHAS